MKVITLCGSTRFKALYEEWNARLTLQGNCVFSCGCWFQQTGENKGLAEVGPEDKALLDAVHKEKIRRSDAIFVINPGGYIGNSTRSEIDFARALGKEISYLESSPKPEGSHRTTR